MPPRSILIEQNNSSTKQPLLKQQEALIFKSNKTKKHQIKCVLVGDGAVGKTSLAVSYSNYQFPNEYVPTVFDNYNVIVQVDGQPISLNLCDTAGQNELDPLRNLCYPQTDVFMLCFSVIKPSSFESACSRWATELKKLNVPIILIGTQADLRNSSSVPYSQAANLAACLNAQYIETSAKTKDNLKEAFDQAILIALQNRRIPIWRKLCCF